MLVDMKLCDSVQFEVGTPHLNRGLEGAKVLSPSFTMQRAPERFSLCSPKGDGAAVSAVTVAAVAAGAM